MTTSPGTAKLACVDVDYRMKGAVAGCVVFAAWADDKPARELTTDAPDVEPYVSGQLYRRELPLLLQVLARVGYPLDVVVVDGNVWLDHNLTPGLGARLWEALDRRTAVIGVAKTVYVGAPVVEVLRGESQQPLLVSAAGLLADDAAAHVRAMHGEHRLPTMIRRADRLCREATLPGDS